MEQQDELPDYYQILNVDRNVDDKNLYLAYTIMVKKYALPPGASPALERRRELEFAVYQKAFSILSNPAERKNYDRQLKINESKKQKEDFIQYKIDSNETEKEIEERKRKQEKEEVERIKAELKQREMQKAEEQFLKAKQFLDKGNPDSAIELLKDIVAKHPKVANYHSYLGLAMKAKGWAGYSQAEFKVALHFDPKDPIALKNYQNPANKLTPKAEEKKTGFFSKLFGKK